MMCFILTSIWCETIALWCRWWLWCWWSCWWWGRWWWWWREDVNNSILVVVKAYINLKAFVVFSVLVKFPQSGHELDLFCFSRGFFKEDSMQDTRAANRVNRRVSLHSELCRFLQNSGFTLCIHLLAWLLGDCLGTIITATGSKCKRSATGKDNLVLFAVATRLQ